MNKPRALLTLTLTLCACSPVRWASPHIEALDRPAGAGDAARGEALVLNRTFSRTGLPLAVLRAAARAPQEVDPDITDATGRVRGREGINRWLPAQMVAEVNNGVVLIKPNCLTCHAGNLLGKTYVGLGNSFMDGTLDLRDAPLFDEGFTAHLDLSPEERSELEGFRSAYGGPAPYSVSTSFGTSTAVPVTTYLFNHRDPQTYAWTEADVFGGVPDPPNLELDTPPWWHFKKKTRLYYGGEAVGDPTRHLMQFMSVQGNTLEDLERAEADFRDIAAYLRTLEPPPWPWKVDTTLASQGEEIFQVRCASCHGTYGEAPQYPSKVVAVEEVGTDPARHHYNLEVSGATDYNTTWHARGGGVMEDTAGYVAPPLDGIWASAPYLHNGAVPTLADLLSGEAERPAVFVRATSSDAYDRSAVGWEYEEIQHRWEEEPDPTRRRLIYDTHQYGKSNAGHLYGTGLPDGEKAAVLEYLKTL